MNVAVHHLGLTAPGLNVWVLAASLRADSLNGELAEDGADPAPV